MPRFKVPLTVQCTEYVYVDNDEEFDTIEERNEALVDQAVNERDGLPYLNGWEETGEPEADTEGITEVGEDEDGSMF